MWGRGEAPTLEFGTNTYYMARFLQNCMDSKEIGQGKAPGTRQLNLPILLAMAANSDVQSFTRTFLPPQQSRGKVIFSEACVKNSVHRGGHAWQGGMCGRGCAWQGAYMMGGMCGRGGACVAGGHAWQGDMHGGGGMHGRGCAWQGCAWQGGMHGRYYEIRSMSGRYTSYWNAFLFHNFILFIDTSNNAHSLITPCRNFSNFCLIQGVLQWWSMRKYTLKHTHMTKSI